MKLVSYFLLRDEMQFIAEEEHKMENYVTLSASKIALASTGFKEELAMLVGLTVLAEPAMDVTAEDEELAELGIQAARAFAQGCGEKTLNVLRAILDLGSPFLLKPLEDRMGVEPKGLRAVWSGLTKRTKTITGEDAALIGWEWVGDDNTGDWQGRLSEVTFASLHKSIN